MNNIEQLFQKYKDDVYRLAISYTKNRQDAEDVCQNVFLKLMKQTNIEPGKEKSWLMKVTANECRSLLRSAWWRMTSSLEDAGMRPETDSNHIFDTVMELEPKYRVVLYLHYYEGYSTAEIAELLRISQSAVTTRLNRGRHKLKTKIEEDA